MLSWQGQHGEALELAQRAVVVDPELLMPANLSYIHMDAGNFDEAIDLADELAAEYPNFPTVLRTSWLARMRAERFEEGAAPLRNWAELVGHDPEVASQIAEQIIDFQRNGNRANLVDELTVQAGFGSENLAQIYAFVGDEERTLGSLEAALEERSGSRSVLSLKVNPAYDFIRADPRFARLLQRAGLD